MRRACKDGHSWMEAADSALYEAKQDGRNCVRVARPALTVS